MKIRHALVITAVMLAGCATEKAFREGERLVSEGQSAEGIRLLADAVRDNPTNVTYRAALLRAKEQYVGSLLADADAALEREDYDIAEQRYRQVQEQHPQNARAATGLANIQAMRRNTALLRKAEEAVAKGDYDAASPSLRAILTRDPDNPEAQALARQVDEKLGRNQGVELPQLSAYYRKLVTLEFRDAPLKSLFDSVSRQSGLNFVFDKEVRTDQRSTVYARSTPLSDVLEMLLASSQLSKKVMNANTLIIYPNTAVKQKEYQDVMVKSFFLANADPKLTMNLIRTMAQVRDVHIDERLNMVVVRDSPEAVRLAEKLVKMSDQPDPEVMLHVEILEVARSKLLELGVQWPNTLSLMSKKEQTTPIFDDAGNIISETTTLVDQPLTLGTLETLLSAANGSGSEMIGISPTLGAVANKVNGDVNVLANPRIRVRNREKAKIHIGQRLPVITSNVTSTGVTSESVNYLDVGLKLDVEPQVYLGGSVAIKIGLEVSSAGSPLRSAGGTVTYELGTRNAATVLRMKDGETQILAGLITDDERTSASKLPGLGDIPVLGRLFSTHRDENNKSEIVLLITPHIIRNIERPELGEGEFLATTPSTAGGSGAGSPGGALRTGGRSARPLVPTRPENNSTQDDSGDSVPEDIPEPKAEEPAAK